MPQVGPKSNEWQKYFGCHIVSTKYKINHWTKKMIAKRVLMSIQLQEHPKRIEKGLPAMEHKHTLKFVFL